MILNPKILINSLLLVGNLLSSGTAYSASTPTHSTSEMARKAVEFFCQMEFEGDEEPRRMQVIKYSKKEASLRYEKRQPLPLYSLFFDQDPLFVVISYQIMSVQVHGHRATAEVMYRRTARAGGETQDDWHLIAEPAHDETVTLNLVFEKNKWWVLDPPPPRISKEPLIRSYASHLKDYASTWEQELNDPNYDEEQKASVRAARDQVTGILKILKNLP